MREYLMTYQGKKVLLHPLNICEFLFLLVSAWILSWTIPQWKTVLAVTSIVFLWMYTLFVLRKFIWKNYKAPKKTSRLLLTLWVLLLSIWGYFLIFWFTEFFIFFLLFFTPFIVFVANFILFPIAHIQKEKKYTRARKIFSTDKVCIKIGITWSYGKSSVKEYLAHILQTEYSTLKTPENINSELWVSNYIIQNFRQNTFKYFVCEMWAYHRWEIQKMWEIVNHQHWFLTAIGTQHIALFGGQENIKKWKAEIALSPSIQGWRVYVNIDSREAESLDFTPYPWANIITYGLSKEADVYWEITEISQSGTNFTLYFSENAFWTWKESYSFSTNLIGKHHISNLAWVVAFCMQENVPESSIRNALLHLPQPDHTLWISKSWSTVLIDDSYNLSVESLTSGIDVLSYFSWEKILVLDDILELIDAAEIHKKLAKKIVKERIVDKIFYVGENYKKYFLEWLRESWFDEKNIISNLGTCSEERVILFEWKRAGQYYKKLM